ncbi:uncharacterized protein LOC103862289 [Brassica rapa]|uniref:uncharacterized protein LOC103862289 n=1 Tax=Brassica campestris TaxID=3711 RepID=UPI00142E375D|nr:uncharacterized protein LOC103862289 [Brassica rapa]
MGRNIKGNDCSLKTLSGPDRLKTLSGRFVVQMGGLSLVKGTTTEELENLLGFRCSLEDCRKLEEDVSEEEIRKVLFAMPSNKSLGPDGYPCEFFKTSWPIIAQDFTVAVQSVFRFGFMPKGINSTILALVPKRIDSMEMRDYRPIACCNVLYKVISKLLANRLKVLLPRIISAHQSAFVQGRLLMENVLLATELVKEYHKEDISPRCLMKIDISKAFDSVQWSFVLKSLEAIGVPRKFIHWINLCISSPSFSVQVNGELAGYFQSTRGLRQGCSLSPYLFVLCMNVLSHKIDKAVSEKKFSFHPRCKAIALTHLCFADDLMVFVEGSKKSIEGALSVFEDFANWSGLNISIEKSTIFMAGVSTEERSRILRNLPFAVGELPVRVQLIKAVLMSIINFWASVFRLPRPELKTTRAKVAWKEICKLRSEGGLGIRALKEVNMVHGLKLIWRMLSGDSLWGVWIKENLLKRKSFWEVKENTQAGSWMWKKMLKLRDIAKGFYKREIGNGCNTSFWYDNWSSKGAFIEILGEGGVIDMGISKDATVKEAVNKVKRRRRRYRTVLLNAIETELLILEEKLSENGVDGSLWRGKSGFKRKFSTKETWLLVRETHAQNYWKKDIWFSKATPKFAFMSWLAMLDQLSTMDRVARWSQGVDVICIWEHLMRGVLRNSYTTVWSEVIDLLIWSEVIDLLMRTDWDKKRLFCIRYAFQAAIHMLWRERNKIKHGETPLPMEVVKKLLEKGIRNKLSILRYKGGKRMENALQYWFSTRV